MTMERAGAKGKAMSSQEAMNLNKTIVPTPSRLVKLDKGKGLNISKGTLRVTIPKRERAKPTPLQGTVG